MHKLLLPLALCAAPLAAQDAPAVPRLTLEQQTALRCGAAMAIVARGQAEGDAAMGQYPALATRGQEFFVRTAARLMDETGADRAAMQSLAMTEAQTLSGDPSAVHAIMPACLLLLEASGL